MLPADTQPCGVTWPVYSTHGATDHVALTTLLLRACTEKMCKAEQLLQLLLLMDCVVLPLSHTIMSLPSPERGRSLKLTPCGLRH
jgi:hypothetical protein